MSSIVGEEYTDIVEGLEYFDEIFNTTDFRINNVITAAKRNEVWPEVAGKTFNKIKQLTKGELTPKLTIEIRMSLLESYQEVCNEFNLALN